MKKSIGFSTPLIFTLFSFNAIANENVFICDNCTYQQAKNFSTQNATPNITCQAPPGEDMTFENQQCFSTPNRYTVFNRSNGSVYGFRLSHSGQGQNQYFLTLQVDDFTPTQTIRQLIEDGVEWYNDMNDVLQQVSGEFSGTITSPQQSFLSNTTVNYSSIAPAGSSCHTHPSFRAGVDAFSGHFRVPFRSEVSGRFNNLTNGYHLNFSNASFTTNGFTIQHNSQSIRVSLQSLPQISPINLNYGWVGQGNNFGSSKVAYNLSIDNNEIIIDLNESQTQLEGSTIPARQVPNNYLMVSSCMREALEAVHPLVPPRSAIEVPTHELPGGGSGFPSGAPQCRIFAASRITAITGC